MKRTFLAVEIVASAKLKLEYELVRHRLRLERIRWVPVEKMHITLNFLGDTKEDLLPEIIKCVECIANNHVPVDIVLKSLGVFKNLREPRVIWVGCSFDPDFVKIKKEIDKCLGLLGYEIENREFSPHLTLGRMNGIRQLNQLSQLITLYKEVEFQLQTIKKLILFESILKPEGPDYQVLREFSLRSVS